jgi:small subunit ribosomal protein S13
MARLMGVDLPRNKPMKIALRALYGVGPKVCEEVLKESEVDFNKKSNEVSEDEIHRIRKTLESYTIEGDLRREVGLNIKRLKDLGAYRGIRHKRGLPVRGQRTHTNARTRKGKAVAIAGKKSIKSMK